jgi:hypothetical protein
MWRNTTHFVTAFPNDSPCSSLFCLLLPTTSPNMALHRHTSPRCHSAGRVTAKLLLSFLAVSAPTAASASYQQQHQPIPILSPFPGQPEPQTPLNNEHVFVSLNKVRVEATYILTLQRSHYGMCSIMESRTKQYTRDWTSPNPGRRCGWNLKMGK